jgi:hypothetical protein
MKSAFPKPWALAGLAIVLAVTSAKADVVTDWNQTAIKIVTENQPAGLFAVRNLAIVHLAIHDAVNVAKPRYELYAAKAGTETQASPEAAALSAAYSTLVALYPVQKASLDALYAKDLAKLSEGPDREKGLEIGRAASAQIVAARKDDGADAKVDYQPGDSPSTWIPTPPAKSPALQPQFAKVKPFFVRDALQFDPGPPAPVSSPEFAKDFDEVKRIGARNSTERTTEQTAVAIFWTSQSYYVFHSVARQVSEAKKLDLHGNARLFALLSGAAIDAYISGWAVKYTVPQARPITFIRDAGRLGNPALKADADWEPLLITPAHPNYISGHSIFAGASAKVLEAVFGTGAIAEVSVTYPVNAVTRRYTAFSQIVAENNDARVWGGIHTRESAVKGAEQGSKIGAYAAANFLKPPKA